MAAKNATATAVKSAPVAKKAKVLTDEDLLKAPEKDYMNDAQLAFFRQRLMDLRQQLLHNADDTGQHLRENEITTDPSDRATLEEEYTLELRTRDRERKLLKKVEKSLKLIDEGAYGYCEETGEPIGIPRLLARPTATLSLEAQERRERVQKLYGD
jgi:DnaK suppressor protein